MYGKYSDTSSRFIVIGYPIESRSWCTKRNTIRSVVLIWLLSSILSLLNIQAKTTHRYTYSSEMPNTTNVTLYQCVSNNNADLLMIACTRFLILFLFPGIIMIISHGSVIKQLWKHISIVRYLTNSQRSRQHS
jgi:hypothetical protein